jgi:hypothetical protein
MKRYRAWATADGYVEMKEHPEGAYVLFADLPSEAHGDLIQRLLAAGHDERLATGQLYLDAAAALSRSHGDDK